MNRKRFLQSIAAGSAGVLLGPRLSAQSLPNNQTPRKDPLTDAAWTTIRDLFPLRPNRLYLNTGGLGPASRPALEAVSEQNQHQAFTGEHHHSKLKSVHQSVADFVGVEPEEICLTRNASESNSIISAGLSLSRGDEVIIESHAHPGGSFAWLNRQKRDGAKVRIFEPSSRSHQENLDRLFSLVNQRTKVIQVSHVTATTGLRFDVHAIAREARRRNIWFHIDGAQSAGMFPFNLREIGCDSFGASGHKWINGPIETGFLYIAAERNDDVDCSHIGAYSNKDYDLPDLLTYANTAQRHEYGTRNAASALGLAKAIELQNEIGRDRIAEHGANLANLGEEGLMTIDGLEVLTPNASEMRNSILTFRVADLDCIEIYRMLSSEYNIRCRVVTERNLNGVRASWHVYHQQSDVDRFVAGVAETVGKLRA